MGLGFTGSGTLGDVRVYMDIQEYIRVYGGI